MKSVILAGLVTAALLPAASELPSDAPAERSGDARASRPEKADAPSRKVSTKSAPKKAGAVPDMGTLTICSVGVDSFVAAAGIGAVGGNLAFGVRDGECRSEPVPGGRYLVQLQGGHPSACSGAITTGSCEIGRPVFAYTQVQSNVQGSSARFDRRNVDVNVAHGGSTKVSFVFRGQNL